MQRVLMKVYLNCALGMSHITRSHF